MLLKFILLPRYDESFITNDTSRIEDFTGIRRQLHNLLKLNYGQHWMIKKIKCELTECENRSVICGIDEL